MTLNWRNENETIQMHFCDFEKDFEFLKMYLTRLKDNGKTNLKSTIWKRKTEPLLTKPTFSNFLLQSKYVSP